MATYEEKLALRQQGLTYREIAERLGISHQAVAQALKGSYRFRIWKKGSCIYANLRKWLNDNKVGCGELLRRMGLRSYPANVNRPHNQLNGRTDMNMKTINRILSVTGLTYEEAFGVVEEE